MQHNIEDIAHGFEIQRDGACFVLVDRNVFNNWGKLSRRFETHERAVDYAYRCDRFKKGRRVCIETWEERDETKEERVARGLWR